MRLVALVSGKEYELDADLSESVEVLKNQIFSIADTPLDDMVLVLEGYGLLMDDTDLSSIVIKSPLVHVRKLVSQLPESWSDTCTRLYVDEPMLQPAYKSNGLLFCGGCVSLCRSDSASEIDIHEGPFQCQCIEHSECLFECRKAEWYPPPAQQEVKRKLTEDCRRLWKNYFGKGLEEFSVGMRRNRHIVMLYEDPELQEAARKVIPKAVLEQRVTEEAGTSSFHGRNAYVEQLLKWFKTEFFTWTNSPKCISCGGETKSVGQTAPSDDEIRGLAKTVEVHACGFGHQTRFPRFNHPGKLLVTRTGRCGEWAICFGLILRASGFDTRLVIDYTDHVWNEIWSEELNRWLHCDSCEAKLDTPLLYEEGWGKKLTYTFAESKYGVRDVIRRYTNDFSEVRKRRNQVPEPWIPIYVEEVNSRIRGSLSESEFKRLKERDELEDLELRREKKEIAQAETEPRESGDLLWKQSRGEMGAGQREEVKTQEPKTVEIKPDPSPDTPKTPQKPTESIPAVVSVESPEEKRQAFKKAMELAFTQLTVGCGNSACDNEYCFSSPSAKKTSPSEAAARALQLLAAKKFRFCSKPPS